MDGWMDGALNFNGSKSWCLSPISHFVCLPHLIHLIQIIS